MSVIESNSAENKTILTAEKAARYAVLPEISETSDLLNGSGGQDASPHKQHVTFRLVLSIIAAVMGSFQFGYNTGVINAPEKIIKLFINESMLARGETVVDDSSASALWSVIVAIFAVGGMIGGLSAGWCADKFGRKYSMLGNCVFGSIGGILMLTSFWANSFEMISIGRLFIGFHCGLYTGLTPVYLSEIAFPSIRGALGTIHQLGVTVGLLTSQILGFSEILGNEHYWHILLGLTLVPVVLQTLTMPFCPESPRFLLISQNREQQATTALRSLRGVSNVQGELDEIKMEAIAQASEAKVGLLQLFKLSSLRMPLMISVMMHLSQQFSGINAIFYYSSKLFLRAGLTDYVATHATSGIGAIMVVMTIITIPLMDRVGRRTLHLVGLGGMFVFSLLITVALSLRSQVPWFNIGSVVVSLIYVVFFALGPGSIPWLIVSELFSQGPRTSAMSIAVLVNWIANFVVGFTFPYMERSIGDFSFLPFTTLLILFWLFTFKFLPETKNKTFDQIATSFRKEAQSPMNALEGTQLLDKN